MNKQRLVWMMAVLAPLSLGSLGCSGEDDEAPLEVIGTWEADYGVDIVEERITAEKWNYAKIVEYDNAKNIVITQNPDGDDTDMYANTFSRIVYLEPKNDSFYYCTTDFGLETLADARAAHGPADDSNPDLGGCGQFPWTLLAKK